MANWVAKGLRTGIKSSVYPNRREETPGVSLARPAGVALDSAEAADALVARCPTGAIVRQGGGVAIEQGRCVHCFRCRDDRDGPAAA
jgi:dissimilatory sulfite reductase (desulfoviridin) alpha/beta subunit